MLTTCCTSPAGGRNRPCRIDDLPANALLLTRATGIRIGECIDLALDCLRQIGPDQWALHVPLGKLHTERLVPVDQDGRRIMDRILALRALAPAARLANRCPCSQFPTAPPAPISPASARR